MITNDTINEHFDMNKNVKSATSETKSEDVVDFAMVKSHHGENISAAKVIYNKEFGQVHHNGNANQFTKNCKVVEDHKPAPCFYRNQVLSPSQQQQQTQNSQQQPSQKQCTPHDLWAATIDKKLTTFHFTRKKSDQSNDQTTCIAKEKPKFVKCATIARLFGNTYSTQLSLPSQKDNEVKSNGSGNGSRNIRNVTKTERFRKCSESQIENCLPNSENNTNVNSSSVVAKDFCDEKDLSARALRTFSKSLSRIWRRSHSVEISTPDPEYKVLYLGNVLTGWAKGDSCVEKPLATLWRNYTQNHKPDVVMRILLSPSGLKATTRQHGLTEYWSNRITHCSSPKSYPRVFCWIYRHEGRKLKHELRCHAVLCPKETTSEQMCKTLKENLTRALREFKRDKMSRQNARLSLVNSVYENPSMPRRKILLSVGANNYRPPMERSKSAPKLMAIEEAVGEEDEECSGLSPENGQNRSSCCKVDPLFPAMTLGRKQCRNEHFMHRSRALSGNVNRNSIQRASGRIRSVSFDDGSNKQDTSIDKLKNSTDESNHVESYSACEDENCPKYSNECEKETHSAVLDEDDDFNSLLMINDYDAQSSLSGELMSYFDSKLKLKSTVSLSDLNSRTNDELAVTSDVLPRGQRIALSLDNLDVLADDDYEHSHDIEYNKYDSVDFYSNDDHDNTFYNQHDYHDCVDNVDQAKTMQSLGNNQISFSNSKHYFQTNEMAHHLNDDGVIKVGSNNTSRLVRANSKTVNPLVLDSDEGSISSGCETSSTVTTSHFDDLIKSERESESSNDSPVALSRGAVKMFIDDKQKIVQSIDAMQHKHINERISHNYINNHEEDCSSEVSDESGFDEFQNFAGKSSCFNNNQQGMIENSIKDDSLQRNFDRNNNDSNNNNNFEFGASTKATGRLMINIPKNAKSILI